MLSRSHDSFDSLNGRWCWLAVPLVGFSTRYSWKRFTLRQHVVLLYLKVKKTTYRDLVGELIEMPRIREAIDLDSIPTPSTLCKAFDRLEMAVW